MRVAGGRELPIYIPFAYEKEGNKKMPIPRQEIIDNPIPTSLFMYYAAVLLCVGTGGAILGHIGTLVNVYR